jgi:signal transduction histidine kinase
MSSTPTLDFSILLASSVHDIKNSLSMLLQSLDEIIETDHSNENHDKYSVLRGEASRINNALIYLLGLYRLEQDQLGISLDEVYVADFLEEQVASQQLLFDIKNIEVTIDCDDDLTAYFDENLVDGIIANILVNDAKYTKDKILIQALKTATGGVEISITDNGAGYPAAIIEHLNNDARGIDFSSGSTNLGLYFAQQIAGLHQNKEKQGSISLSNIEEGGGKFTLTLP